MKEGLIKYLISLINNIPLFIYGVLLTIFIVGAIAIFFNKRGKLVRGIALLVLSEYISFLYFVTIIYRVAKKKKRYDMTPFWSYDRPDLLFEIIMNIIVFVPIGFLMGMIISNISWWKALIFGGGISLSIEILQLLTHRGVAELDDLIHNTLGCLIGYGCYALVRFVYERVTKRRVVFR